MPSTEAQLSQASADALNEWMRLEDRYRDSGPQARSLVPGEKTVAFHITTELVGSLTRLGNEREVAQAKYDAAMAALANHKLTTAR